MTLHEISAEKQQQHAHLRWLVQSRSTNQLAALQLLEVLDLNYCAIQESPELSRRAQCLVGACFSLWRAAFLADKKGKADAVIEHTREFLAKIVEHNAIAYPQDYSSREWTFNYYMNNAGDCLLAASVEWPEIEEELAQPGGVRPRRRWERYQGAFESAVEAFRKSLPPPRNRALRSSKKRKP